MADEESGAVIASNAAFKAPAAAPSPLEANASNADAVAETGDDGANFPAEGGRRNRTPYFVSCSDACFCAFCILFVVALSLSFALGIAYVQDYNKILSNALTGLKRHEAPVAGAINGTSSIRLYK